MRTLVAVLGAGSARRFAGEKLSLPCAGKPLARWALEAATATGFDTAFVARKQPPYTIPEACELVVNPDADRGIGTSIACASHFACEGGYDGLIVTLADMPLITPDLLIRLPRAGTACACRYPDGRLGAPAFFPSDRLTELRSLDGDKGAAHVLARWQKVVAVECDPVMLVDVDSPDDLEFAVAQLSNRI